jgi:hypothetical protein
MRFTRTQTMLIIFSIGLFVVALLFSGVYGYLTSVKLDKGNAQYGAKQKELIQLQKDNQSLAGQIGLGTKALQVKLPVQDLIDRYILDLENVEAKTGVTFTGLEFLKMNHEKLPQDSSVNPDSLKKVQFKFSFVAQSNSQLNQVIAAIEKVERITEISELTTTRLNAVQAQVYKTDVTLSIYYADGFSDLKSDL